MVSNAIRIMCLRSSLEGYTADSGGEVTACADFGDRHRPFPIGRSTSTPSPAKSWGAASTTSAAKVPSWCRR